jgi:hypothetical protein
MSKIISSNNDLIRHRPTSVTILGVLFVIAGALTLLGGQTALAQESGSILTVLGVLLIPLGIEILCIASFVVAYSLFEGKSWAWSVQACFQWLLQLLALPSML